MANDSLDSAHSELKVLHAVAACKSPNVVAFEKSCGAGGQHTLHLVPSTDVGRDV